MVKGARGSTRAAFHLELPPACAALCCNRPGSDASEYVQTSFLFPSMLTCPFGVATADRYRKAREAARLSPRNKRSCSR